MSGTPHNITLSNVLRGTASLIKNGGALILAAANFYSGSTLINQGTLALGVAGAIGNSSPIIVGTGCVFDVSAVSGGFAHIAAKTLGGFGGVQGAVSAASGSIINPGSNTVTGTLTFSNSLTESGGVFNHFDLSANPAGPNNDLVVPLGSWTVLATNLFDGDGNFSFANAITPGVPQQFYRLRLP